MITYKNKSVLVTGAGSGIGLALSRKLISEGAKVWLTDINEEAVVEAASSLGSGARSAFLDVRDSQAIKFLVQKIVKNHGSIDFIFNNAGIGIGGEMQDLDIEHFDRIIDINIRGVMNGVWASYAQMVKQGHGCIVNTASAAGLLPAPLLTPYAMTKHAVVGLTRSLRIEGEHYGVQVNALCPTAIDTPLLDAIGPEDLIKPDWIPNIRNYLSNFAPPFPVDQFASYVLKKIKTNQELIIAPSQARFAYWLSLKAPSLLKRRGVKIYKAELKNR